MAPKLTPPGRRGTRLKTEGWDEAAAGRALQVGNRCTVCDGQGGSLSQGVRAGNGSGGEAWGSWDYRLRAGKVMTC